MLIDNSKIMVESVIAIMDFRTVGFLKSNPPNAPATSPLAMWNIVQGPCPPNMKKFDRYQLEAPTNAPFLIPNNEPARSAMNVIGSMLAKGCSKILPRTAVVINEITSKYSSSFNRDKCFCTEWIARFSFIDCS